MIFVVYNWLGIRLSLIGLLVGAVLGFMARSAFGLTTNVAVLHGLLLAALAASLAAAVHDRCEIPGVFRSYASNASSFFTGEGPRDSNGDPTPAHPGREIAYFCIPVAFAPHFNLFLLLLFFGVEIFEKPLGIPISKWVPLVLLAIGYTVASTVFLYATQAQRQLAYIPTPVRRPAADRQAYRPR